MIRKRLGIGQRKNNDKMASYRLERWLRSSKVKKRGLLIEIGVLSFLAIELRHAASGSLLNFLLPGLLAKEENGKDADDNRQAENCEDSGYRCMAREHIANE